MAVVFSRVRMSGPLEAYALGFADELLRVGYTRHSARFQLHLMAHVSRWLASEDLDSTGLTSVVVERFVLARVAGGYTNYRSPRALALLLDYLRGLGVAPAPADAGPPVGPVEQLLDRYRSYLLVERGLTVDTVSGRLGLVRPFLVGRVSAGELDLEHLSAGDVSAFVVDSCCDGRCAGGKAMVAALRSLLRFLHAEGLIRERLADAVSSVAGWRLAGLPRALEDGQARLLLDSCDRRTTIGRRDFAILTLLVRLGLRAGEVAVLELEDIDWRAGEIVVRGKGNRRERLPLPADVGRAVGAYLRRGRPASAEGRCVFVRFLAPHRALSRHGVKYVVTAAGRRAGLGSVGAHQLRHTAATEMLRAGAPLPEIGQVLRHRALQSTAIYAKVDREALRSLARPWLGGGA
jgi:site-specific recombinase XerD